MGKKTRGRTVNSEARYAMILMDHGRIVRAYLFKNEEKALRLAMQEAGDPNRIADAQHVVLWDTDTQTELFATYNPGPRDWSPRGQLSVDYFDR